MIKTCRNHGCRDTSVLTRLAPAIIDGMAVDGELEFCSVGCLVEFCSDPSNFPVIRGDRDEIFVSQPDLDVDFDTATVDADGGGDTDTNDVGDDIETETLTQ